MGDNAIVKVRFLGHLRTILGVTETNIEIQNNEVLANFLDKLANLLPQLGNVIKDIKEHSGEYLLLINDVDVNVYGDIKEILIKNGDTIIFIPIAHGGKS